METFRKSQYKSKWFFQFILWALCLFYSWRRKNQRTTPSSVLPTQSTTGCWPRCLSEVQISRTTSLTPTCSALIFWQKSFLSHSCVTCPWCIHCTRWPLFCIISNSQHKMLIKREQNRTFQYDVKKICSFLFCASSWFHTLATPSRLTPWPGTYSYLTVDISIRYRADHIYICCCLKEEPSRSVI